MPDDDQDGAGDRDEGFEFGAALDDAPVTGGGITGPINQAGVQTGDLDVAAADSLLDAIGLASAAEVAPNRWLVNGTDFITPPGRHTVYSASRSP